MQTSVTGTNKAYILTRALQVKRHLYRNTGKKIYMYWQYFKQAMGQYLI
jgi:hypothetical protein